MEETFQVLSSELQSLRGTLNGHLQTGNWKELSRTLNELANLGQHQGHVELCLRAQSLRELMGTRAGGRAAAGRRFEELINELLFHLSHLQWQTQTSN